MGQLKDVRPSVCLSVRPADRDKRLVGYLEYLLGMASCGVQDTQKSRDPLVFGIKGFVSESRDPIKGSAESRDPP